MVWKGLAGAVAVVVSACATAPVQHRVPVDRERFPINCDDGNPLTPDDTLIDGLCVGIVDPDGDGIPNRGGKGPCAGPDRLGDCFDNCRFVANADQLDSDGNGIGDACSEVAEWDHVETRTKVVALTFDDGYNDQALSRILESLEQFNARATFFLNGTYVAEGTLKPATLKRLKAAGHLSGNHTFSHDLGTNVAETRAELVRCEQALDKAAEIQLRPLFRSPAYARRLWLEDVLVRVGYSLNLFASLDVQDWTHPPPPVQGVVACVSQEVEPGDIILFHVGPTTTPIALPAVLKALSEQGYQFVTAEELLYFGVPVRDPEDQAKLCKDYY